MSVYKTKEANLSSRKDNKIVIHAHVDGRVKEKRNLQDNRCALTVMSSSKDTPKEKDEILSKAEEKIIFNQVDVRTPFWKKRNTRRERQKAMKRPLRTIRVRMCRCLLMQIRAAETHFKKPSFF